MKSASLFLSFCIWAGMLQAQTTEEWLEQSKTQQRYLVEQLKALKAYGEVLEEGYAIAQEGLSIISEVKGDDYQMHRQYFKSLLTVNPKLKSYWKVSQIVFLHSALVKQYHQYEALTNGSELLTPEEKHCSTQVFQKLMEDGKEILNDLKAALSDNLLQLSDHERLRRIDALFDEMREHHVFARHWAGSSKLLMGQRSQELKGVAALRSLYDK